MPITEKNNDCCGCGACESICPRKAIVLQENDERFLYPRVDISQCINCGLCVRVCPLYFNDYIDAELVETYVGRTRVTDELLTSASGGAFSSICKLYLGKGYKVYGAVFDKDFRVIHSSATTLEEAFKFKKSKYIQSYYNDVFERVARDLSDGIGVLFSGVSCQCAALLLYLNVKKVSKSKLVTINILCHGVPNQALFDDYRRELEKKASSPIVRYEFKNKRVQNGELNSRTSYVEFENGKKYIKTIANDAYLRGYYSHLFYRTSCGNCKFKRIEQFTDFSLADAWDINKIIDGYNPHSGVSLILVNTTNAKSIIKDIDELMELVPVSKDWAFSSQIIFQKPCHMHPNRSKFFSSWKSVGFEKAVFRNAKLSWKERLIPLIPRKVRKIIKHIIMISS